MRKSPRNSKKKGKIPENLSDLAAWLYTDLLLGLAVAFVGAGTFLVRAPGPVTGTPKELTYQLSCDEVVIPVPRTIGPQDLDDLVNNEMETAALANEWLEPRPGLLYIYGGSGGQDVGVGSAYAKSFNTRTVSKTPILGNVEKIEGGDKSLASSQIRLKIYFVYKGDETKNGCQN